MASGAAAEAIGFIRLAEIARLPAGDAAGSPLAGVPYLLLRLETSTRGVEAGEEARIARWLQRRVCPVLALAESGASERLQAACDVVAADEAALDAVIANIRQSPLAAMVLVQVLRATEHMAAEHALVVESLAYATLQGGPEFRRWLAGRIPRDRPAASDPGPAVVVARSGDTLEIRLNRPSRRNAMSVEVRDGLYDALQLVVADPSIRRASLAGNGPCFSSGGDLDEFGTVIDATTGHAIRGLRLPAVLLLECAERVEFRLHGACIGAGVELPAFGRRVRAAQGAYFQLPEIRMGLIPGAGGCVSIPRRIGRQRTAYMALSAERIEAPKALSWGLIDSVDD